MRDWCYTRRVMTLPIQLSFFRKLELYQELKSRNKRLGKDKAWNGEKEILRWTALSHRHLGIPINVDHVKRRILSDKKYDNFPADAERPMENLINRGYAHGNPSELRFLKDGLLMGEVIVDVENGKGWHYAFWYYMTWIVAISGVVIAIASALKVLWPVFAPIWQFLEKILWKAFNYLRSL